MILIVHIASLASSRYVRGVEGVTWQEFAVVTCDWHNARAGRSILSNERLLIPATVPVGAPWRLCKLRLMGKQQEQRESSKALDSSR